MAETVTDYELAQICAYLIVVYVPTNEKKCLKPIQLPNRCIRALATSCETICCILTFQS